MTDANVSINDPACIHKSNLVVFIEAVFTLRFSKNAKGMDSRQQ